MGSKNIDADGKSFTKVHSIPQATSSAFPIARLMSMSLVPTVQIILAIFVAYRCYPIIPMRDIIFCILYPAYLFLANHLRFDNNAIIRKRPKDHPHNISVVTSKFFSGDDTVWFQIYMVVAASIGLILPLVTVFYDPKEIAALGPHLFVLWCQIIGESVTMFNPYVHRFITLLVPLGFSAYRMNILVEWFLGSASLFHGALPTTDISVSHTWGLALSSLNLVFWTYNLFVTLLLLVTPEFLSDEICESPELHSALNPHHKRALKSE